MFFDKIKKLLVHIAVAGHHFEAENIVVFAIEIANMTASLLHNNTTCCHVPRLKAMLEKAIVATASDITQINSRSTQTSDATRVTHELFQDDNIRVNDFKIVVWKACRKQSIFELVGFAHENLSAIEVRTTFVPRIKTLASIHFIYHAQDHFSLVSQSNTNAITRYVIQKISRDQNKIRNGLVLLVSIIIIGSFVFTINNEFRLPNGGNVKKFSIDNWDFLFLRGYMYKQWEKLDDRKMWSGPLSRWDEMKLKILGKIL